MHNMQDPLTTRGYRTAYPCFTLQMLAVAEQKASVHVHTTTRNPASWTEKLSRTELAGDTGEERMPQDALSV